MLRRFGGQPFHENAHHFRSCDVLSCARRGVLDLLRKVDAVLVLENDWRMENPDDVVATRTYSSGQKQRQTKQTTTNTMLTIRKWVRSSLRKRYIVALSYILSCRFISKIQVSSKYDFSTICCCCSNCKYLELDGKITVFITQIICLTINIVDMRGTDENLVTWINARLQSTAKPYCMLLEMQ